MTDKFRLFSFGTLQDPAVQRGVFGRTLSGSPDTLRGFRVAVLHITDAAVLALSGVAVHPLLRPSTDPGDAVTGTVFEISRDDLDAADHYEVADYGRFVVSLASGRTAWVYVDRQHLGNQPYRPSV